MAKIAEVAGPPGLTLEDGWTCGFRSRISAAAT